jgi:hypothetical protein
MVNLRFSVARGGWPVANPFSVLDMDLFHPHECWLASRKLPGNSAANIVKCLAATPSRDAGKVYSMDAANTRLHHAA